MKGIWDGFDGIYLLGYTRNLSRMKMMKLELERVNVWERVDVYWNFPSPYDDVLKNNVELAMRGKYVNVVFGHYRILKTALELGKERILILEDDIRFLRDKNILHKALGMLPRDCGVSLLDNHWASGYKPQEEQVNDYWWNCLDKRVSSAAYALSKDGLRWVVDEYESPTKGGHGLRCCDQIFERNLIPNNIRFLVSNPRLAIQVDCGQGTTKENDLHHIYKKMKVNENDYG